MWWSRVVPLWLYMFPNGWFFRRCRNGNSVAIPNNTAYEELHLVDMSTTTNGDDDGVGARAGVELVGAGVGDGGTTLTVPPVTAPTVLADEQTSDDPKTPAVDGAADLGMALLRKSGAAGHIFEQVTDDVGMALLPQPRVTSHEAVFETVTDEIGGGYASNSSGGDLAWDGTVEALRGGLLSLDGYSEEVPTVAAEPIPASLATKETAFAESVAAAEPVAAPTSTMIDEQIYKKRDRSP